MWTMDPARDYYALGQQVCKLEHDIKKLWKTLQIDRVKIEATAQEDHPLNALIQDCNSLLDHVKDKNKSIQCNIPYKRFEHFHTVYLEIFEMENDYLNVHRNYVEYLKTVYK